MCFYFSGNSSYNNSKSKVLFPEHELVTETEPDDDESDGNERSEEERLDEFKQFVQENDLLSEINGDDKELESLATLGKEALLADKQFRIFKKRISREPKQVCNYVVCVRKYFQSSAQLRSNNKCIQCTLGVTQIHCSVLVNHYALL